MGYKVRVSSMGLTRDFGSGKRDNPYQTKSGAEKLYRTLARRYSKTKYPDAKVRIVTTRSY